MKKKISAILAVCMLALTMTACGETKTEETTAAETTAAETTAAETTAAETTAAETTEAAAEETEAAVEEAAETNSEFSLLDVSSDMIGVGVYGVDEEGNEVIFSQFTTPDGTPMVSLFVFDSEANGDVICGEYEYESETDEDGIEWTLCTVNDVYTGDTFNIGFGESEDEVYIFNLAGESFEGKYLDADETVTYMGTAAAFIMAGDEAAETSGEFSLLDVTSDMIGVGVYGVDEEGNEVIFSQFTTPDSTPMVSLFVFDSEANGDVICGEYEYESETDEDGIEWTLCTGTDVYTGETFNIGFGESEGEVYIFNLAGETFEGKYLDADETITYMGTAAAFIMAE